MSADAPSNEMFALLRVLENVENAPDELPISTVRKPADGQDEAKSKPVSTKPVSTTEDLGVNPFVERVAAAMSRFRDPASARMIG
jgi:hypothetical protein